MEKRLEGRVAKILDESRIIITLGRSHGVKEGMKFVVISQGDVVKDPETGEELERWEIPKGRIVAEHVQEKISICGADVVEPQTPAASSDPSTRTLSADMVTVSLRPEVRGEARRGKLNINKAEMEGMPEVEPISVGDIVRAVEE